jgi:LysM repeat protein
MPLARRRTTLCLTLALCLALSGCARPPKRAVGPSAFAPPPVSMMTGDIGFYHTVERGQTLYRIAKTYSLDWKELAKVNRVSHPSQLEVGQRLFIPYRSAPETFQPALPGPMGSDDIRRAVGARRSNSVWRTLTVHHSGTKKGNAALFGRDHTRRRMGGLFYHFVIGNGTDSPDGALEVGFRWRKQIKANRPNDIQICLVGDFNQQYVTESQFSTLVLLMKMLREDYNVPIGSVRKHEDIKGKHTACPGKHFPFERLITELMRQ